MSVWTRVITRLSGVGWRFPADVGQVGADQREEVARQAIRLLREAELDFDRCGQLVLSRAYRQRAAMLEQQLGSRRA